MRFNADWTPARPIRMGEAMGVTLQASNAAA